MKGMVGGERVNELEEQRRESSRPPTSPP